jgi:hypothetical protein
VRVADGPVSAAGVRVAAGPVSAVFVRVAAGPVSAAGQPLLRHLAGSRAMV